MDYTIIIIYIISTVHHCMEIQPSNLLTDDISQSGRDKSSYCLPLTICRSEEGHKGMMKYSTRVT